MTAYRENSRPCTRIAMAVYQENFLSVHRCGVAAAR